MQRRSIKNTVAKTFQLSKKQQQCFATKFDPNSYTPFAYDGPSIEEIQEKRKRYLSPALFAYYKKPIMPVEGKMQYVWDEKGRRYLDFFGGIVTISVGHSHPKVVEAGKRQLDRITHTTTIYMQPEVTLFGEELAAKMPGDLKVTYFVNSGSEANDLALLMARMYTGCDDVIALRNCYHGMGQGTMGITALNTWRFPVGQGHGIKHVLNPDTFRGPYGPDEPNVGEKYAWDVKNVIEHVTPGRVAGFIAETIQGVGGTVEMPKNYLKSVYKHVRDAGGLCIADEVQGGFARTGEAYWSFQNHDVLPDIVTMAKGIGNGIPLAAVVTTPQIAATLSKKIHFNTYGGNPLCAAMGRAVLKAIDEDGIQQNCLVVGGYLKQELLKLQKKYSIIGDVRGRGLMLGVELVKDMKTKEPAKDETNQVFERMKDLGVLIGKGGLYGNVFRIKPPMCINKENVDEMIFAMDKAFSEL